jgi:hypothetical protein
MQSPEKIDLAIETHKRLAAESYKENDMKAFFQSSGIITALQWVKTSDSIDILHEINKLSQVEI